MGKIKREKKEREKKMVDGSNGRSAAWRSFFTEQFLKISWMI